MPPPRTTSLTEHSINTASPQKADRSESRSQSTDGRADLLKEIRDGKRLKSTKQTESAPVKSDSPRDNLLAQVREAGKKRTAMNVGERIALTTVFGNSSPTSGQAKTAKNEDKGIFGLIARAIPKEFLDQHQNRPLSGSGDDDADWAVEQREATGTDDMAAEERRSSDLLQAKLGRHFKHQDLVRVAYQKETGVTLFMTRDAYQDMVDPAKRKDLEATRALVDSLKQESVSLRDAQWSVEIIELPKAQAQATPVASPSQQAPLAEKLAPADSSQAPASTAVPPPPPPPPLLSPKKSQSAEESPLKSKAENDIKASRSDLLAQIREGTKLKATSKQSTASAEASKPVRGNKPGQALKFLSGAQVSLSKYLAELAKLENADTAAVRARRGVMTISASASGETRESESDDVTQERADEFALSLSDLVTKASGSKNSSASADAVGVTAEETSSGSWKFLISISSEANQRLHEKPAECRQLAVAVNKSCESVGFDFQDIVINIR